MLITQPLLFECFSRLPQAEADHLSSNISYLSNSATDSRRPAIAVGDSNVYAVWDEGDGANEEIFFTRSTNGGSTFDPPVNLSENGESSTAAQIAVSDGNVYVLWEDGNVGNKEIFFTRSTNGGSTFDPPVNLSNENGESRAPRMAISGTIVYVVWSDYFGGQFDILFTRSTNGGSTFDPPVNLSNNSGFSGPQAASISASGSNVYVAWQDDDPESSGINFKRITNGGANITEAVELISADALDLTQPQVAVVGQEIYVVWDSFAENADILLKKIIDNGDSLDLRNIVINVSNNAGISSQPEIMIEGTNIYVAWVDDSFDSGMSEVMLSVIADSASGQGCPINVSSDIGDSRSAKMAIYGTNAFLVWHDVTSREILLAIGSNLSEKSIAIENSEHTSIMWGLDAASIGGSLVNTDVDDTVFVDWGDGTAEESIVISGCSWGPAMHTYDSTSVGNRTIQVFLRDDTHTSVDNTSLTVEIRKHTAAIVLDAIASGPISEPVIMTGTLTDADANAPIENATITFNGTGVIGLVQAVTDETGAFSANGSPVAILGQGFTAQAMSEETALFSASASNIQTFDSTAANSTEIPIVDLGQKEVTMEIPGRPAVVLSFENITQSGSLFVSECASFENERYIPLSDSCISIASSLELAEGSAFAVEMSIPVAIPDGLSAENIDMFLTSSGAIRDITYERDTDGQTVRGRTDTFGNFVLGAALHPEGPQNAVRSQVFVGKDNEVFFRNYNDTSPAQAEITFDKELIRTQDTGTVVIVDRDKNLHPDIPNLIHATVSSNTDPSGIALALVETGPNSSTFEGSFTTDTEDSENKLHVESGDEVKVLYKPSGARLKLTINGITESGLIQVTDTGLTFPPDDYLVVGGAVRIELIDSQKTPDGTMRLTMTYANTPIDEFGLIFDNDQGELRLIQEFPSRQWNDITIRDENDAIIGVNTDPEIMTVTGETTTFGTFALAFDTGPPGGCGGGCALPGSGVVLDSSAKISAAEEPAGSREKSGDGGGGGSRSTAISQPASGNGISTSIQTESGVVSVYFESIIEDSGQLKINSYDLSKFEAIFEDIVFLHDNNEHGIIRLDGRTYSTAGNVYDIDASNLVFDGVIDVTLPYDEDAVMALGTEADVRFLHYDEVRDAWKDMTKKVDPENNTVTGTLSSLSPVTSALVLEERSRIIESSLQSRLRVSGPLFSMGSEQLILSIDLQNRQFKDQPYVMIVQLVDEHGIVQYLDWEAGSLELNHDSAVSLSWDKIKGKYLVQVLILTDLENPWLLADVIRTHVEVT